MIDSFAFISFAVLAAAAGVALLAVKVRLTHLLLVVQVEQCWPQFVREHRLPPEASAKLRLLARCFLPILAVDIVFGRRKITDPLFPSIVPALRPSAAGRAGAGAGPGDPHEPTCWVCGDHHPGIRHG